MLKCQTDCEGEASPSNERARRGGWGKRMEEWGGKAKHADQALSRFSSKPSLGSAQLLGVPDSGNERNHRHV